MWSGWKSAALGAAIRVWAFRAGFHDFLSERVEISTPINSWKRGTNILAQLLLIHFIFITSFYMIAVIEGVYLEARSQSAFDGNVFHESPVGLVFYSFLLKLSPVLLQLAFIFCDVLTALALTKASSIFFAEMVPIQQNLY